MRCSYNLSDMLAACVLPTWIKVHMTAVGRTSAAVRHAADQSNRRSFLLQPVPLQAGFPRMSSLQVVLVVRHDAWSGLPSKSEEREPKECWA